MTPSLFDYKIELELLGEVSMYIGVGIQVLISFILGGAVGMDREFKSKVAGLKTNILICIGACLYTTISMLNAKSFGTPVDPNRLAAQIVSGIGFLGAGAIVQSRGQVQGLTTAATIWVVAAIGFTIGSGYPVSATFFTITVLMVLKMINPIIYLMERMQKKSAHFHMEILSNGSVKKACVNIVLNESVSLDEVYEEDYKDKQKILHVLLFAHPRVIDRIKRRSQQLIKVKDVIYRQTDEEIIPDEIEDDD